MVPPPKRILGIKIDYSADSSGKKLVRVPTQRSNKFQTFIAALLRPQGFLFNFVLAISHFALILLVPLLTPVITFFALST